eukprot:CAMPEP_0202893464 /NCGR_PEP_ID=MMETSP1392-20130828/3051_1 /ASSEMBLY_ACC=CAM_ASM_000868 /TAXON_ID=225041 /ORGANISM="Chlamydomonas chlamydogama, Strain SAG 11-48b" /LENGTH=52 /DNA_ID=CAMNT_0049577811 /DNA_START=317 /DNA_END=475 /DNA_ORIENTATION=-
MTLAACTSAACSPCLCMGGSLVACAAQGVGAAMATSLPLSQRPGAAVPNWWD